MTTRSATLIGLSAILMWSLLAVLTVATGKIPAFQLAAMTFAIGGLVGLFTFIGRPEALSAFRQPPLVWAVGFCTGAIAWSVRGFCRRLCLGELFGNVAAAQGRSDRCGRRILSRHG